MLHGWPVVVLAFGLLLTLVLLTRRVRGAILLSIVAATVLAVVIEAIATIPAAAWGNGVPKLPSTLAANLDFGLLGHASLFGGFAHAGVITALVFIFTLILSDFFDAMGTIVGISNEAGLLDDEGRLPGIGRVLFIDGLAAVAGGLGSCSSNTCFIESASGVGEGARTGLANVVTGALFAVALFFTPIYAMVPSAAATPALVAVGFLLMTQVRNIDWDDYTVAVPAFLTMILMPFTYSITNGIGAGFVTFVVLRSVAGRARDVKPLLWVVAAFFVAYFMLSPIEQWLGVR